MTPEIKAKAQALYRHLNLVPMAGNVGCGKDDDGNDVLRIYIFGAWNREKIAEWDGIRVEWHIRVGRPRATAQAA